MKRTIRHDYRKDGKPATLIVTVRFDDECRNGHDTFSITGDLYLPYRQPGEQSVEHKSGATLWLNACGCLHEEIAKQLPSLGKYIRWHLCSTDGPLYYVANTVYHASDRDCHGLRAGEFRQFTDRKTGAPLWRIDSDIAWSLRDGIASAEKPAPITLEYVPYGRTGEGKARELDHARASACWPDATDEDLISPGLEQRLLDRLPGLLQEFHADMAELFGRVAAEAPI